MYQPLFRDAARENAIYVDKANSAFIDFTQQQDLNNVQMAEGRGQQTNKQGRWPNWLTPVLAQKNRRNEPQT